MIKRKKKERAGAGVRQHGLSESALNKIIDAQEKLRRGRTDYPWPNEFKDHLLGLASGLRNLKEVIALIQREAAAHRGGDGRMVAPTKSKKKSKPAKPAVKLSSDDLMKAMVQVLEDRGYSDVDLATVDVDFLELAKMDQDEQIKVLREAADDYAEKAGLPDAKGTDPQDPPQETEGNQNQNDPGGDDA